MMVWLTLQYDPVSTFELRPSNTTKTGGKTLLVPTPYAIKMALLDRIIRHNGIDIMDMYFSRVRDLTIHLRPPLAQAVNRTFQKILRPAKGNAWNETIAMREFVVQAGELQIALGEIEPEFATFIAKTAASINYFGQRGSFYQLLAYRLDDTLPENFVDTSTTMPGLQMGYLQRMDDMNSDASFKDVSTFSKGSGARRSYNVAFPYQMTHNGHNHSVWERI